MNSGQRGQQNRRGQREAEGNQREAGKKEAKEGGAKAFPKEEKNWLPCDWFPGTKVMWHGSRLLRNQYLHGTSGHLVNLRRSASMHMM